MKEFSEKSESEWDCPVEEKRFTKKSSSRGQVIAEYVIMLIMALAIVLALMFFLAVFTEYNWRITALLGWEP